MIESLYVLVICAISCGIIGVFILLRGLSMVTDAISHSVLLGIVLAFFVTHSIDSPLLLISASLFGVLTVLCVELLGKTKYVKKEDAVGIVFPLFFSAAVILITKFARNVHIDTEIVVMGDVILAPLNRMALFGTTMPKFLVVNIVMLIINILFIVVFYKELKATTFDNEFAMIAGFSSSLLFYALMTLVSMTAVASFNAVGSILVISFFITPGATAYLLTKKLSSMLLLTAFFGFISSLIGFYISVALNVSMAGMCAFVGMVIFIIATLVYEDGIITKFLVRIRKKREQLQNLIIIHMGHHQGGSRENEELSYENMCEHLNWDKTSFEKYIKLLKKNKYIFTKPNTSIYNLTEKGMNQYYSCCKEYGISVEYFEGLK